MLDWNELVIGLGVGILAAIVGYGLRALLAERSLRPLRARIDQLGPEPEHVRSRTSDGASAYRSGPASAESLDEQLRVAKERLATQKQRAEQSIERLERDHTAKREVIHARRQEQIDRAQRAANLDLILEEVSLSMELEVTQSQVDLESSLADLEGEKDALMSFELDVIERHYVDARARLDDELTQWRKESAELDAETVETHAAMKRAADPDAHIAAARAWAACEAPRRIRAHRIEHAETALRHAVEMLDRVRAAHWPARCTDVARP